MPQITEITVFWQKREYPLHIAPHEKHLTLKSLKGTEVLFHLQEQHRGLTGFPWQQFLAFRNSHGW